MARSKASARVRAYRAKVRASRYWTSYGASRRSGGTLRTAYSVYTLGNTRQPVKSGFPSLKAAARYGRAYFPAGGYRIERYQTNLPWRG